MIIFLLSDRRASRTEEIKKYGKRIFCKTRLFNVYLFVFSTLIYMRLQIGFRKSNESKI